MPDGPYMTDEFMKQIQIFVRISNQYLSENSRSLSWKDFLTSPLMDRKARKAMYVPHELLAGTFKTLYEFDFRNDLNFPVPVYFITGEEDTACPHSLLKDIVDEIIIVDTGSTDNTVEKLKNRNVLFYFSMNCNNFS